MFTGVNKWTLTLFVKCSESLCSKDFSLISKTAGTTNPRTKCSIIFLGFAVPLQFIVHESKIRNPGAENRPWSAVSFKIEDLGSKNMAVWKFLSRAYDISEQIHNIKFSISH